MKSKLSQNTVAHALQFLHQLLSRPPWASDVHASMAALEHLVDTARENADADVSHYNAILLQTRSLAESPVLQRVLLKLLGSKEEIAMAKEIDKATKSCPPTPLLRGQPNGKTRGFPRVQPYMVAQMVLSVSNAAVRVTLLTTADPGKDALFVNF